MEVNINKVIYPDFSRNVLGGCRDNYDELPLVYTAMNPLLFQLRELSCLILVLL